VREFGSNTAAPDCSTGSNQVLVEGCKRKSFSNSQFEVRSVVSGQAVGYGEAMYVSQYLVDTIPVNPDFQGFKIPKELGGVMAPFFCAFAKTELTS
jgi:hypothetical protein